jgi:hypothetical protein
MRRLGLGRVTTRSGSKGKEKGKGKDLDTRRGSRYQWGITPMLETSAHEPYLASIVRNPHTANHMVDSRIKDRPPSQSR